MRPGEGEEPCQGPNSDDCYLGGLAEEGEGDTQNTHSDFAKEQRYRAPQYWLHVPVVQGAGSVAPQRG